MKTLALLLLAAGGLTACSQPAPPAAKAPVAVEAAAPIPAAKESQDADASASEKSWDKVHLSGEHEHCMNSGDAAKGVTPAMLDCAQTEYERQDGMLNDTYKHLLAGQDDNGRTQMRDEQRKWIKRRDAACNAEADAEAGGTLAPVTRAECLAKYTAKRTAALQDSSGE